MTTSEDTLALPTSPHISSEQEAPQLFDHAFADEILTSERTRAVLLALMFGSSGLFLGVALRLLLPQSQLLDPNVWIIPPLSLTSLALYELWVYRSLRKTIRARQQLSPWRRQLNTLVEVSLVTCNLLGIGLAVDPLVALVGPPPLLYFGLIILSPLVLNPRLSLLTGGLAAAQYAVLSIVLRESLLAHNELSAVTEAHHFVIVTLSMLICAAMATAVTWQIRMRVLRSLEIAADRQRVLDLFGKQVSPDVVDKLLSQPTDLSSEERFVCVMFADIRGFTTFSEERSPKEVVDYLNTLWGEAVDIINHHGGYINKFLGDGFMALFGVPLSSGEDCQRAVLAAQELLDAIDRLVQEGRIAPTEMGIGIHAGLAVTGNIGSSKRLEYSVIGDVVNTASRIEGLTKHLKTPLLISEAVFSAIEPELLPAQRFDDVAVRGRATPMTLYGLAALSASYKAAAS